MSAGAGHRWCQGCQTDRKSEKTCFCCDFDLSCIWCDFDFLPYKLFGLFGLILWRIGIRKSCRNFPGKCDFMVRASQICLYHINELFLAHFRRNRILSSSSTSGSSGSNEKKSGIRICVICDHIGTLTCLLVHVSCVTTWLIPGRFDKKI